ncbi:MAG: TonB-dependent receptor [Bacteroidetes bacterium]|nr:TonB-dependent receptor [Bacteroidota bacterium]
MGVWLLCLFTKAGFAQTTIVLKGQIQDTTVKISLTNATVNLLRAKDSVLLSSTRTDKEGKFQFSNIIVGTYIVMVSYPQYADFIDKVQADKDLDLNKIYLNTKSHVLKEVIVRNNVSAIRIKGDTTEYRADSFRVGPNADVQELLKHLPGIQVNSKGEIKAQGEKVNKLLVDGEEFFSDDPAVVTKNLRADIIDKVQVFDKKSDQAAFTGIDDGVKSKTINLQLKEDKKNGYFGKAELGNDFKQYSNGKILANAFKGKRKIAGYITSDNTSYEALNWEERQNYADGGGMTTEINDDGGISMYFSGGGDFESNNGLPNQQKIGALFSNKWKNRSTNNTAQYQRLQTNSLGTEYTKTILEDSALISNTENKQISDRKRVSAHSINQWGTDSTGLLKLDVSLSNTMGHVSIDYSGITSGELGNKINQTTRSSTLQEDEKSMLGTISYRKKYAKKGRTISFNTNWRINNKLQDGTLLAENDFFDFSGFRFRSDSFNQLKEGNLQTSSANADIIYTEPISAKNFLLFKYGLVIARNDAKQFTYDQFKPSSNPGTKYDPAQLVDSLSNHFVYNTLNNSGSINFRHADKKLNYVVGSGFGVARYNMKDQLSGATRAISFNNFIPSLQINYTPKQQRRISFNYNGQTENPKLQQIQPLINNADPLNITIGNPNLQQSFENRFSLNASDYKVLKSRYISFNANYANTISDITTSNTIDSLGRRVSQYVNVNGNYSYGAGFFFDRELFEGLNGGVGINKNFNRYINILNGIENINDNNSSSYSISLNHYGEGALSFYWRLSANNRKTVSSIRPEIQTNYWSYESNGNLELSFKKVKTYFAVNLDATLY